MPRLGYRRLRRRTDHHRPTVPEKETTGIRLELVTRIKQEIQTGAYETEAKLEIALMRFLESLA